MGKLKAKPNPRSSKARARQSFKIPLILTPQPEGGFTVTSPLLPELITEGDTMADAMDNVQDALAAVVELYQDLGRSLPRNAKVHDEPVWLETLVTVP